MSSQHDHVGLRMFTTTPGTRLGIALLTALALGLVPNTAATQPEGADYTAMTDDEVWQLGLEQVEHLSNLQRVYAPDFSSFLQDDGTYILYTSESFWREPSGCYQMTLNDEEGALVTLLPRSGGDAQPVPTEDFIHIQIDGQVKLGGRAEIPPEVRDLYGGMTSLTNLYAGIVESDATHLTYGRDSEVTVVRCHTRSIPQTCTNGESRTCEYCSAYVTTQFGGVQVGSRNLAQVDVDCSQPCRAGDDPGLVAALNTIALEGLTPLSTERITFYRDRAACEAALEGE